LKLANDNLRELSSRLQQIRDEERRQIARELHDSVGQLLAALGMNIAVVQLQSHKLDSAGARAVSENAAMVEQISTEIRTISHLLHPPLLDVAGLASALRWYVDGFSERSKIKVNLEIPEEFGRLSDEMEIAIFRMVQECLTNIHRHSGGTSAAIRVHEEDHRVLVEVKDQGKGIPPEKQVELNSSGRTGVGFRGMRERFRQLGGTLVIRSDNAGTEVSATLPLRDRTTPRTESKAS
jgi:signal transduction histidine kinase